MFVTFKDYIRYAAAKLTIFVETTKFILLNVKINMKTMAINHLSLPAKHKNDADTIKIRP